MTEYLIFLDVAVGFSLLQFTVTDYRCLWVSWAHRMIVHCIDTPNDDGAVRMRTPVLTSRVEDGERIWRADLEYYMAVIFFRKAARGGKNALECDKKALSMTNKYLSFPQSKG